MGKPIKPRRLWTEQEDEIMRSRYPDGPTRELAQLLDRTEKSIYTRAKSLGIAKSEAYLKELLAEEARRIAIAGKKYRFHKGQTPQNKGKKMPPDVYARCKDTMFKPGIEPHNTKYDGYQRISKDGYIEVRVRKGKFVAKHHLVWKEHFGPIPKGHIVAFKDNNPRN